MKCIEIKCQGAGTLPLDAIIEFQGNLKKLSKSSLKKLKNRILQEGFIAPIFIWEHEGDNFILDGHQRLQALLSLRKEGFDIPLIPVDYIQAEGIEDAKRKLLSITSQYGEFDLDELHSWLSNFDEEIRDTFRFVDDELKIAFDEEPDDTDGDDEVNEQVEPVTKLGDLWELGKHRVLCGDSTVSDAVLLLTDGNKADLFLTDPPYNVEYEGKTKEKLKIKNDKQDDGQFRQFLVDAFSAAFNTLKSGGSYYIWHSDSEGYNFRGAIHDIGRTVRQCIIWNKNSMVMGRQDYQWKHEPCLYGWNDGAAHSWYTDRKQTTVIDMDRPSRSTEHPTMKPVLLFLYQIENSSKAEDIILDTFLGSGTTLIACEKTNRICYGMELDPHYVDVIVNRYVKWCEANGKIPEVKLNGEPWEADNGQT